MLPRPMDQIRLSYMDNLRTTSHRSSSCQIQDTFKDVSSLNPDPVSISHTCAPLHTNKLISWAYAKTCGLEVFKSPIHKFESPAVHNVTRYNVLHLALPMSVSVVNNLKGR